MQATAQPIQSSERIDLIDVLRGFAVFGILMVNMPLMFEPITAMFDGLPEDAPLADEVFKNFILVFFTGKFYLLFSSLFGFGFWIFIHKGGEQKPELLSAYKRRLFFLLLFGIAHITFLWPGDILFYYALFGFLLILFRNTPDRKARWWMMIFIFIPSIFTAMIVGLLKLVAGIPEVRNEIERSFEEQAAVVSELVGRAREVYSSGSFAEVMAMNWEQWLNLTDGIVFFYSTVLGMFIFGYMVARRGILSQLEQNRALLQTVFRVSLFVAIVSNTLLFISDKKIDINIFDNWLLLNMTMSQIGGLSLMLVYVSGFALLFANGKAVRVSRYLAPVGRMALTNYISHSLITAILFMPWGFGLFGKIAIWQGVLLSIAIYAMQIPLSSWWLSRYQFGPLEWLWRSLTYLKLQPFRKG
jgi:uncharacterized protein